MNNIIKFMMLVLLAGLIPSIQAQTDCNAVKCDGENCQPVSLMSKPQCETLLAIYQNTNGLAWKVHENWNTTNEPRDFALVVTNNEGNVVELNLGGNRLQGSLPDLSSLSSLEKLNLYANQLTGPIPALTNLTALKMLNLRNNQFNGAIPALSSLTQLEKVSFYANQLCGQIPDLSALTHLQQLDLSDNQLTGPIPDLSQLSQLKILGLNGNQLCRAKNANYTGFEYAVNQYPLCSNDAKYPTCVEDTPSTDTSSDTSETVATEQPLETDSDVSNDSSETVATEQPLETGNDESSEPSEIIARIPIYQLDLNLEGIGLVTIEDGSGCETNCRIEFKENTIATLTATPSTDSVFVGWRGACSNITSVCQVTMTQNQTVTATFNQVTSPPATTTLPSDLEFVGIEATYKVGDWLLVELVEHLTIAPRASQVDLWVAVEYPTNIFHFMTESWLQPFSPIPQPFRRNLLGNELATQQARYHLLSVDMPAGVGGTYNFYAIYNEAGTDLSNLLKTQQSKLAFATFELTNNLNPSSLPASQTQLTMLVGEELELVVDSQMTLDAILHTCTISQPDIVQSNSAVSSTGSGVSCYLKALKKGNTTLTTVDKAKNNLKIFILSK